MPGEPKENSTDSKVGEVVTSVASSDLELATFTATLERMKLAVGAQSDAELGKALGLKQQTVASVKKRKQVPPVWVTKIAQDFGVSADWILFGEGERGRSPASATSPQPAAPAPTGDLAELKRENAELRRENAELRAEERELRVENRQLLKENADLRVELARREAQDRASPSAMPDEATRRSA